MRYQALFEFAPVAYLVSDPAARILEANRARLPDETLLARAVLLANELVTNAVVHAHTDIRLRLELRGYPLHIGVRDGDPRLLFLVSPGPRAPSKSRFVGNATCHPMNSLSQRKSHVGGQTLLLS